MRRIIGAVALITALCSVAWSQQDIFITGTNPYTILARGAAWGSSAGQPFPGVNNNFLFPPLNPNTQVCLYITNNNPTNSHAFTVTLLQAGDPAVKTFQNVQSKWAATNTNQVFPITVPAASTKGVFFNVSAAAYLTAQFTGTTAAGGSPDTADIFAVQTTSGGCGLASGTPLPVIGAVLQGASIPSANFFPVLIGGSTNPAGSGNVNGFQVGTARGFPLEVQSSTLFGNGLTANNTLTTIVGSGQPEQVAVAATQSLTPLGTGLYAGGVKTNILEMQTDLLEIPAPTAYSVQGSVTNPAANATILHSFSKSTASVNLAYKWLTVSCSAACELKVNRTNAQGTTCTAVTVQSLNLGAGGGRAPNTGDVAETACATQPTVGWTIYDLQLPAGGVTRVDIGGYVVAKGGTGNGLDVVNVSTLTGIATSTIEFGEQ